MTTTDDDRITRVESRVKALEDTVANVRINLAQANTTLSHMDSRLGGIEKGINRLLYAVIGVMGAAVTNFVVSGGLQSVQSLTP